MARPRSLLSSLAKGLGMRVAILLTLFLAGCSVQVTPPPVVIVPPPVVHEYGPDFGPDFR
jgi:hypothetical protein